MTRHIMLLALVSILSVSTVTAEPSKASADAHSQGTVNTEALAAIINSDVPVVILDARPKTPATIPGAKQVVPEAPLDILTAAAPDKNALIITYCSGPQCQLSNRLATRLLKLGYTNVIEYPEGFSAWRKAGKPIQPFDASKKP